MISQPAHRLRTSLGMLLFAAISTSLASCAWIQPPVASGDVLFQDDFSLPSSGWDRYQDETYEADYTGGVYRMQVFTRQTMVWSLPGVNLQDVRIVVEAHATAGTINNLFGTICRYENANNFDFFLVSSDGFVGIGQYKDGKRELLTDESLLPTDAIPDPNAWLTITSICKGDQLQLDINGQTVAAARIQPVGHGDVGLLVGTYDEGGVTVQFDNLSVTLP
ncbi:MAG: hypothetical protein ACK2T2_06600 [Anaerolineales bacterium]|jgi:hypothetical protein